VHMKILILITCVIVFILASRSLERDKQEEAARKKEIIDRAMDEASETINKRKLEEHEQFKRDLKNGVFN